MFFASQYESIIYFTASYSFLVYSFTYLFLTVALLPLYLAICPFLLLYASSSAISDSNFLWVQPLTLSAIFQIPVTTKLSYLGHLFRIIFSGTCFFPGKNIKTKQKKTPLISRMIYVMFLFCK